jgi:hypothetical protein
MSEEEARQKWCPYARADMAGQTVVMAMERAPAAVARADGKGYDVVSTRCIGASCMAWRWEVTPGEIAAQATGKLQYTVLSHAPIGFCGLAGQP